MMVPRWVLEFDGLRYLFMVLGDGIMNSKLKLGILLDLRSAFPSPSFTGPWKERFRRGMLYAVVPEGTPPVRVGQLTGRRGIELNHVFVPLQ